MGRGNPLSKSSPKALHEFRATGKKVISYGNEMTQARYYIAAQSGRDLCRSDGLRAHRRLCPLPDVL